jgi:hypothetical protein
MPTLPFAAALNAILQPLPLCGRCLFCHANQTSRQKTNPRQTPSRQARPEECRPEEACPRQGQGPPPFEGNDAGLTYSQEACLDKVENLAKKYLAELREVDVTFEKGTAVLEKYRAKYPELASYIPEIVPGKRRIEIRQRLEGDDINLHLFAIRVLEDEVKYEVKLSGDQSIEL